MSEPFITEITESDQQGLRSVLDAALKQAGLPALQAVAYFSTKFRLLEQVSAPADAPEAAAELAPEPETPCNDDTPPLPEAVSAEA